MSNKPKILAFAGSTREGSYNKKLVKIAAKAASECDVEVKVIDLRDYPLPLYDEDLESAEGIPENAIILKKIIKDHDGFLIASPEYNSSISAVLKNTIDWVSRPEEGEPMLVCFSGKVAALLSASPGNWGGMRGLVHLRSILGNIKVLVLPDQFILPGASEEFNDNDLLIDSKKQDYVEYIAKKLANTLIKLKK